MSSFCLYDRERKYIMKEIWKNVKGYEGLYQISNKGEVKSLERIVIQKNGVKIKIKEKILKKGLSNNGYYTVALCDGKTQKTKTVHRLVAEAFIPNPNNYICINHKDENKQNNCVDNLEWCTYKYNNNYREKNNSKKIKVNQYDLKNNLIKKWNSISEVEKEIGIDHRHICRVCKGKRKTTGGFIWKYED